ncbi:hypothetical protein CTI12_AA275620 [Artemisia annua]|uniref:Uncharacterized protein n=1 Tax=Artemisia annua TaxID=35608 RepID=A0A2U1M986_ARTAN|nr:hypothetical protein CTI12_AA275620 [Artemisia annua]
MEAMRAESALKHEEIMDLLKKLAISMGRAKEVEEWEKWRDLNRAQEASENIISNPKSQIFVNEDCEDGSTPEENLVVTCSNEEIVKYPTQPTTTTTKISGEDGGILEELMVTLVVEKTDFTRPILAANEDLGHKLIDDLDEPLTGKINKNEFFVAPLRQSSVGKQNQAEHQKMFIWQIITLKLGCEIYLGYLWTNFYLATALSPKISSRGS